MNKNFDSYLKLVLGIFGTFWLIIYLPNIFTHFETESHSPSFIVHPPQYCTILYCAVLYCTVMYCTVLHCTDCTALHCTALYCTVLYCTVLYCNVLHCTVLHQVKRRDSFLDISIPVDESNSASVESLILFSQVTVVLYCSV